MNNVENEIMEQQEQIISNTTQKYFCANCGAELTPDQIFCPKCGHKKGENIPTEKNVNKTKLVICTAVGIVATLTLFFIFRGIQAKEIVLNKENITIKVGETAELLFTINPDNTKNKEVTWSSSNDTISNVNNGIIEGINEGTCTITVKTSNGKTDVCSITVEAAGPDLTEIYNEYCLSTWASIASDGSYLSIDTNPNDSKYNNDSETDAITGILAVNNALGLPDSIIEKMGKTRALDGMQSAIFDGIEVNWSYHPENGLEVIYILID